MQQSQFVTSKDSGFTGGRQLEPYRDALQRFFEQYVGDEQRKDTSEGRWLDFADIPTLLGKSEERVGDVFYTSFKDIDGWWKRAAIVQMTSEWNTVIREFFTHNVPYDRTTQEVPPRMVSVAIQTHVKGLQEYNLGIYTHLKDLMVPEGVRMFRTMVASLALDMQLTFKMNLVEAYRETESFYQAICYSGISGMPYDSILSAYEMERATFLGLNRDDKGLFRNCARMQQLFASAAGTNDARRPNLAVIPSSAAAYIPMSGSFETEADRRGVSIATQQLNTGKSVAIGRIISGFEILVEQAQVGFNARLESHSVSFIQRSTNGQVWLIDGTYPNYFTHEIMNGTVGVSQLLSIKIPSLYGPRIVRWIDVIGNALPINSALIGASAEMLGPSMTRATMLEKPDPPPAGIDLKWADVNGVVPPGYVRSAPALYYHFFVGDDSESQHDTASKEWIRAHVILVENRVTVLRKQHDGMTDAVATQIVLKKVYGARFPERMMLKQKDDGTITIYTALLSLSNRIVDGVNFEGGTADNDLVAGWGGLGQLPATLVWQDWLPFGTATLPRAAGALAGRDDVFSVAELKLLPQYLWGREESPRLEILREMLVGMSEVQRVIALALLLCNGLSATSEEQGQFDKNKIGKKNTDFVNWMKLLVEMNITPPYSSVLVFSPYQSIDTHGMPFLNAGGAVQKWGFMDTSLALNVYTLGIILHNSVFMNSHIMSNRGHYILPHVFYHGRPSGFGVRVANPTYYHRNRDISRDRLRNPERNPDSIFVWAIPGNNSLEDLREAQALQFFGQWTAKFIPYDLPNLGRAKEEFFGGIYFGQQHFGINLASVNDNRAEPRKNFDGHDKYKFYISGLCFQGSADYYNSHDHSHSKHVPGNSHLSNVNINTAYSDFFANQIPTIDDKIH